MSIVKEIDKLSGTGTRSRNIVQAIDKLTGKGPSMNIGDAVSKMDGAEPIVKKNYSISVNISYQDNPSDSNPCIIDIDSLKIKSIAGEVLFERTDLETIEAHSLEVCNVVVNNGEIPVELSLPELGFEYLVVELTSVQTLSTGKVINLDNAEFSVQISDIIEGVQTYANEDIDSESYGFNPIYVTFTEIQQTGE